MENIILKYFLNLRKYFLNLRKYFLNLRKYFFKIKEERYTHCLFCGKELKGSQRKFCSDKCNGFYHRTKYKPSQNPDNAKLRKKYMDNEKGYKDKSIIRNASYKFKRLKGKCYLCQLRKATDWHHPDYNKPKLVYPLCRECHKRHHSLIITREDK